MSNEASPRPLSMAEASREYRRTLAENYRYARQVPPRNPRPQVSSPGGRPTEAQLPAALREVLQRARAEQPQRRIELLKYRHTVGEQVVMELDDGAPLPPEEQLLAASVTSSLVAGNLLTVEVHLVIGAWLEAR